MTNGSLMKVKKIADTPLGAFCNTFDLHYGIIGLENQFSVFLRVAVLHCTYKVHVDSNCILQRKDKSTRTIDTSC